MANNPDCIHGTFQNQTEHFGSGLYSLRRACEYLCHSKDAPRQEIIPGHYELCSAKVLTHA
eukprot:CAMPEP_0116883322 /NCGR_PEP_ID=MMETSP0463-20121206/15825_1 /TAXON_ID=181622 /ORGANISM="Strombidinopsis sp, Strain SopsisLIS2011" /LENGTH=60 /DNA_ID=CAMNT_0004537933 /DNA_START=528 /DNA_END=710 /DNA_ORIENTATION=-